MSIPMIDVISSMDKTILFFIHDTFHFIVLDKIMIVYSLLGNDGLIWVVPAVILAMSKKTRPEGLMILAALVLCTIIGDGILKPLIHRPRPYADFPGTLLLIQRPVTFSFPSGHTASSFAGAYVYSRYFRKFSLLFWFTAGIISFSRLYLFMHYPTDILAGIIIGLFCGRIIICVFGKIIKKGIADP
jgi:undecaprenyl-diphosphatase